VISATAPGACGSARVPTEPGQRLGGYELIERIGQGSQGEVWRALRLSGDGEDIALKVLPPILARDPNRLAQFRHEAERGARISGPGVVTTYEFGESNGVQFMVMPLVDGCSLSDVVYWRRQPGLVGPHLRLHRLALVSERDYHEGVGRIMARVARGLAHVHSAGVVHRDIKPANILLDRRRADEGFLCDFGLGRDLDVATPAQMRDGAGTPLYMAPERLLRYRADERLCDIYALGATLYEAVALAPPFQVPEELPWHAWPAYLAEAQPVPPSQVRPGIPPALDAIILRAIERHPDLRYPSADALARDLDRFVSGEPVKVRRSAC
jgi:serine/threonine-protein kinase